MDEQLIQRSRYLLRARIRRAQTSPKYLFPSACKQLLEWSTNHPIFSPILKRLSTINLEAKDEIDKIVNTLKEKGQMSNFNTITADTVIEHAATCYHITIGIANLCGLDENIMCAGINQFASFLTNENHYKISESIEPVRDVAIDGLFEYLDEQLDNRNAIYGLLTKYKQRCEWFFKNELRDLSINGHNGLKGERALVIDLQKYIFDQGVEFVIEPVSSSGEVDLILRASEGKYLIIDAKYIKEDLSKSAIIQKISSGFHQVMRYCEDYNEPEGFLVTFLNTDKRISLDISEADGFPFITIGSKVLYHIFINICDEPSASKSGKAEEIIISSSELKENSE
jgi:hypothetical protein